MATVNDTGLVEGVAAGTVTISASAANHTGSARVRVGPPPQIGRSVDSVGFTGQAGQASPAPQDVTITNIGGLSLTGLSVGAITYGPGPTGWLFASLAISTAPATLTITAATGGITVAGVYTPRCRSAPRSRPTVRNRSR